MIHNCLRTVFDLAKYVRVCPELLASGIFPKSLSTGLPSAEESASGYNGGYNGIYMHCWKKGTTPQQEPGRQGGWGGGCLANCNMYTGSKYWSVFQSSSKTIRHHLKTDDIWIRWFGNVKNSKMLSQIRIRRFLFASADLKINPLIWFLNLLNVSVFETSCCHFL